MKYLISDKTARNSSFEMIRVVAMSLIIIHHFIYFCVPADIISEKLYLFINPFFYTGVNLFFLISGWFSIKFSLEKIFSFIFLVFFYDILNIGICLCSGIQLPILDTLRNLIFPVSASPYWFLKVYLFLILFSPIINKGLQNLSINYFRLLIIILTIATVTSGCLGGNISNSNGFSFGQGLYVYILGFYLRTDDSLYRKIKKWNCIFGYFFLLLAGSFLSWITTFQNFILYNSFSIIGAAVFMFIILSKFNFKNKLINMLGAASVGCYMLQDGLIGRRIIYRFLLNQWENIENIFFIILFFLLIFISFWIIALIINPIFKNISGYFSNQIIRMKFLRQVYLILRTNH